MWSGTYFVLDIVWVRVLDSEFFHWKGNGQNGRLGHHDEDDKLQPAMITDLIEL